MKDPSQELVIGHYYFSVQCDACLSIIPLAVDGPVKFSREFHHPDNEPFAVACPFCGHTVQAAPSTIDSLALEIRPPAKN